VLIFGVQVFAVLKVSCRSGRAHAVWTHLPGCACALHQSTTITDMHGHSYARVGCNVENASYGLCICAERSALVSAVSAGFREFSHVAVITDLDSFCTPCGSCRQFIVEFGLDIPVVLANAAGTLVERTTSGALLPGAFTPKTLQTYQARAQQEGADA
jgi:homotetrameric cytidine deaminase